MDELQQLLFEKYKNLDRICKDKFHTEKGVTEYITRMDLNSYNGRQIEDWNYDYQMLKIVRDKRNKLAHDSVVVDVDEEDVEFVNYFIDKLCAMEDPLMLLTKKQEQEELVRKQKEKLLNKQKEESLKKSNNYSKSSTPPPQTTTYRQQPSGSTNTTRTNAGSIVVWFVILFFAFFLLFSCLI